MDNAPVFEPRAAWLSLRLTALLCLFALSGAALAACGSEDTGTGRTGGNADATDAGGVPVPDVQGDAASDAAPDSTPDDATDASDVVDPDASDATDGSGDTGPEFPPAPFAVNTLLSTTSTTAGSTVVVNCQAIDESGEAISLPPDTRRTVIAAPAASAEVTAGGTELRPLRTGTLQVACSLPTLGLVDDSPAQLEVLPGLPYTMIATLDQDAIEAGEFVQVFCTAFDILGNEIPDVEFTVGTDPGGSGVEVDREYVIVERAGVYDVRCDTDGAAEIIPATLEVVPGLPATASVGVVPERRIYGVGDTVELQYSVSDEFGNLIPDALVTFSSLPTVPSFGEGRFRFDTEGIFQLNLIVGLPTLSGSPIIASRSVTVNSEGPAIICDRPSDGAFLSMTPGANIEFRGRVNDVFGSDTVVVNDVPATLSADGLFVATIPTRFGINFVQVAATDTDGNPSRRTCAFLVADQFVSEGGFLTDSVTLTLFQNALDDFDRFDGLDSINDLLHTALNSSGVRNTLHTTLQAANPLYDECVQRVCIFGCFCALDVSVNHQDTALNGPNDTTLQLVDGGMRAVGNVRGLRFRLRIGGTFSTQGWVTFESLGVDLTFNAGLSGGRPRITLRSVNNVAVGRVDTDFSGLTGFIVNIIVDLFQGTIRNLIRDTVRDYVRDSFNEILDGVVGGLNLDSVGQTFSVNHLDGEGVSNIGFGIQFGAIDFTSTRALFGISTRLTNNAERAGLTLGAPVPPGPVRYVGSGSRVVAAGISIGVFNQALHALWRSGLLDASIDGSAIGDVPAGSIAAIRTNLPPVVAGSDENSVSVHIGAIQAVVVIPGIIDQPLEVELGGVATTGFDLLDENVIRFRDIVVEELHFSPENRALTPTQLDELESFLLELVRYLVDESVNSALPALPIPDFALPDSLAEFGFAPGTRLGLVAPRLFTNATHFVAEGNFGNR